MSEKPVAAAKEPFAVEVVEGRRYYWCSCGRSKTQPFCDGSHQDSAFEPVVFSAKKSQTVYLCGCKQTADRPYCDGTHNSL
jgi:CDGSH iron-sulfur domain-containing protein 3